MSHKNILIVHPYDRTTFFLKRINNYLQVKLGENIHYFNVKPNDVSHNECLEKIRTHPSEGLVIFLGHGRSDNLYGGKSDNYSDFIEENARMEHPDQYFYQENFINKENIEVFSNKKVFCLSCNSNDKISDLAVEKGAITFLGFGNIPTSIGEFKERGKNASNEIIKAMKTEISYITKKSLFYALINDHTFTGLLDITNFITNQSISAILTGQKWFKERYLLTDFLYYLKNDIKIKGNKNIKLIS